MAYTRISARRGSPVDLKTQFMRGGVPTDPFAIYRVEIYRTKIAAENIIDVISVESPLNTGYPSPLVTGENPGEYKLVWSVPEDAHVPDIYFDVWYFHANDPRRPDETGGTGDLDLSLYESRLIQICNRFWVYPDKWYTDGGLQTIKFGFEPLDTKFNKPEVRPLEVGLMPMPLYDYDYNLVAPIIPYVDARISIKTENDEMIVDSAPMTIKLRQGAYRTNPFVLSYLLNTVEFFIGTYKYRVLITLPDGTTRVSGTYYFSVS